ncbi:MAG: hypothetical protein VKJ44_06760, partial [Synechococcus sp.]|nr:hypothetical protein [Synechococcus sp.]
MASQLENPVTTTDLLSLLKALPDCRQRRGSRYPHYVTSLRTSAKVLLQQVRDRWSIENSWHGPRDTQLKEDSHRYREPNGIQILATLRSLA